MVPPSDEALQRSYLICTSQVVYVIVSLMCTISKLLYLFKSALPPLNLIPVPFIFISPLLIRVISILASDYIIISLLTAPLIDEDLNNFILA